MNEQDRIRMIIADDNFYWCETMRKYLQQFKEIEILGTTSDGEEQIEMITKLNPDIVITDLKRKTGISGLEVLKRCQEMQLTKTKFIVETATYYNEQTKLLINMGIKHILFKPYTFEDLKNEISAVKNENVKDLMIVKNDIEKKKKSIIDMIRQKLINLKLNERKG